uniref:diphthine methyl ester synthase n=1 Tax=Nothobranchius furzeri TaxID=105023 RepID=A0A8C6L1C3_NOTFU
MLYLVGLGLGDATDITVKGLQAVKRCSRVYLEAYTSILTVGKEALEEFYGKQLILADRDLVEQGADEILKDADVTDVAFLVVGDPFGATTHSDLVLRAVNSGIPYKVVHNASIMNAVGCCGLQQHFPDIKSNFRLLHIDLLYLGHLITGVHHDGQWIMRVLSIEGKMVAEVGFASLVWFLLVQGEPRSCVGRPNTPRWGS